MFMYTKLRALMFVRGVSITDLSKELNIDRNTVSDKIKGKGKFYVDEICIIRDKFFPDKTLDEICKMDKV